MIGRSLPSWFKRRSRRLGDIARDAGDWTLAACHYQHHLAADPSDFAIWVQLGHVTSETGEFDAAERAYSTAETLKPDDSDLLLCWGHLRKRRGDLVGAQSLYVRSAAVDDNVDANRELRTLSPIDLPTPEIVDAYQPEAVVESAQPIAHVHAGRVHRVEGATLYCVVMAPLGADQTWVEFRSAGQIVGCARLHPSYREGDGYVAKTIVDLDGDAMVSAFRMPDGPQLENSPIHVTSDQPASGRPSAWSVRIESLKPFVMPSESEVALFITHSRNGAMKPHVLPYLEALRAEGIAVLLIAVTDRPFGVTRRVLDVVAGVLVRENAGYDFAAWAHAIYLHPEVYGARTLYLLNDSLVGPAHGYSFKRLIERIRRSEADLVGLTENYEFCWHLQSYFLALKPRLLSSIALQDFFANVKVLPGKEEVIRAYELRFANDVVGSGHTIDVMFPTGRAANPTLLSWRKLLDDGFPFMKLLLLRGSFGHIDTTGWREAAMQAGFDLDVIDATIQASDETIPHEPDDRLIAYRAPDHCARKLQNPLKIAFFGPWNFKGDQGTTARGLVAAIRQTGARLNLHPILLPNAMNGSIGSGVDIIDFNNPADIAIIQLSPDNDHVLTDFQIQAIRAARRRILYLGHTSTTLPESWRRLSLSIDRIWTPSSRNAGTLFVQSGAPVDLIPTPFTAPLNSEQDHQPICEAINVPNSSKILLAMLHESLGKHLLALIRAFVSSRLAVRGWYLILPCGLARDLTEAAHQLGAAARGAENVILLDKGLSSSEQTALRNAADVCVVPEIDDSVSNRVVEAMAAGKPVVAASFGAAADMLHTLNGYPLTARLVRPEPFTSSLVPNATRLAIDETELAKAFVLAAEDVEAGNSAIRKAARARITEDLSIVAVGERVAESLRQTMTGRSATPVVSRIGSSMIAGVPFVTGDIGPQLRTIQLFPNNSPRGSTATILSQVPRSRDRWVGFAPEHSLHTPLLGRIIEEHTRAHADIAIFYGDDFAAETEQAVDQIRLKPDFDVTLLAAQDYIGAPLFVRGDVLHALGGLRCEMQTAAVADLLFRAHAAGFPIARIPEVLIAHPRERPCATPLDYKAMLAAQPMLRPYDLIDGETKLTYALARRFVDGTMPPITIIIPTCRALSARDGSTHVEALLAALAITDWPAERLTVLVGDDFVDPPAWMDARWPFTLRRIATPRGPSERFNYAAKMNVLWRAAETEQLVFINDDVRPLTADWLKALQTFALDENVGGVGARLYFEDGSLQHAGIAPHRSSAAHIWVFRNRVEGTYQDWARVHREWSMVTGAVFATRRSVMTQINGFDEDFTLEFNDTDLCLRLRAFGYRIVYTPHAELSHVEKASRGEMLPPGNEVARFLSRWRPWLDNDPSWHPLMRRDCVDMVPHVDDRAWYV